MFSSSSLRARGMRTPQMTLIPFSSRYRLTSSRLGMSKTSDWPFEISARVSDPSLLMTTVNSFKETPLWTWLLGSSRDGEGHDPIQFAPEFVLMLRPGEPAYGSDPQ